MHLECLYFAWNRVRADFREGDEDSNSSIFRVQRFSEWPEPLHWIAFPVEILTKPLIHWIASPLFTENPFSSLKSASSHPLPKNRFWLRGQQLHRKTLEEFFLRGPPCRASRWKKNFFLCKFWAVKNFQNLVKNGRWKTFSRPERG